MADAQPCADLVLSGKWRPRIWFANETVGVVVSEGLLRSGRSPRNERAAASRPDGRLLRDALLTDALLKDALLGCLSSSSDLRGGSVGLA